MPKFIPASDVFVPTNTKNHQLPFQAVDGFLLAEAPAPSPGECKTLWVTPAQRSGYTIQSLATAIQKSEMTVMNALKSLEQQGLIYRQRQGAGMPNRIFVKVQTEICPARGAENCPAIITIVNIVRNIQEFMIMRRSA